MGRSPVWSMRAAPFHLLTGDFVLLALLHAGFVLCFVASVFTARSSIAQNER